MITCKDSVARAEIEQALEAVVYDKKSGCRYVYDLIESIPTSARPHAMAKLIETATASEIKKALSLLGSCAHAKITILSWLGDER